MWERNVESEVERNVPCERNVERRVKRDVEVTFDFVTFGLPYGLMSSLRNGLT